MSKKGETNRSAEQQEVKPARNTPFPVEAGDAGSIDKIRDLLFGNQVRDFERRFARMEEHLKRSAADLHDEVFKRLEAVEQYFREELETLKVQLKSEAEKRLETDNHQQEQLKSTSAELTLAIEKVEGRLSERSTELRQQILQQSKDLISTIQSKYDQADKALTQAVERLDESKLDRTLLAEYLVEVAMRLSDHPQAPGADETNA